MDDLEKIRQKKLNEMMSSNQDEIVQHQQAQQQISQLEDLVKTFLTKEALERYGNLKTAHPQKAMNVLGLFAQLIQQGQIKEKVDDIKFKEILKKLEPKKREFKITRK